VVVPDHRYPVGTVRALMDGAHVSGATSAALARRLAGHGTREAPRFFDPPGFATLRAMCARLIPQDERPDPIDVAAWIDARIADSRSDGWRYATMPPDGDAFRLGLQGIDDSAVAMFAARFSALDHAQQDAVLLAVQRGAVSGAAWGAISATRFFEELLTETVEAYYSHPIAQEEIGYAGMADVPGWQRIGLNDLEDREPRPVGDATS